MKKLIIVGLSTTSRHVYSFVKSHQLFSVVGFAVNTEFKNTDSFCGLPVFSLENLKNEIECDDFEVFVAILWNRLNADRKAVYEYCQSQGYKMANLVSPLSVIRSEITGDNIWIHDYVVIQNDVKLGNDVLIMSGTLIGANSNIGSHCFFGAHSILGGGSTIGKQSFVGLHSTIFDATYIGKKCIIGACTAVKRNMPDFSKYVTPSDNIVIKQYSDDEIENKLLFSKNVR